MTDATVVKFGFNSLTSHEDLERAKVSPRFNLDTTWLTLPGVLQRQGFVVSIQEYLRGTCSLTNTRYTKIHTGRVADLRGYRGICQLAQEGRAGCRAGMSIVVVLWSIADNTSG